MAVSNPETTPQIAGSCPHPAKCQMQCIGGCLLNIHPPPDAARPADEWHEDHGPVLWWHLDEWGAISEAPLVARNDGELDNAQPWPGYYTHWSPLPVMPQYPVRELMLAPHGALICDGDMYV